MGRLLYSVIGSLDGYVNDTGGGFEWAMPGEDLVDFIDDELESVGTHLYGRRMYEVMQVWDTDPAFAADSPASLRFARLWQQADKVVFSRTLTDVPTARTQLVRAFQPDLVQELKSRDAGDLAVSGPTLAAVALRAGLVDEIHRFVAPAIVGGGTPLFPDGLRLDLELVEQRRFDGGLSFQRYRVR